MPRTAWNKRLTPEIEQVIIARYQSGLTARAVLKQVPFKTTKTVYDVLAKHSIAKRSPHGRADYKSYNEAVFANVDTPEKAYWLGILITDGYISDTRKGCEPQIGLQMVDRELLNKFKRFLRSSNPVQCLEKRSDRHQTMYRVTVSSRRMANDLSKYGVVPRKTFLTFLPILSHNLMPHLLRGILDGDGTVSHRWDGGVIIGFCGSERLVTEVRMWLICKLAVSDNKAHKNGKISFIQWSQRTDVRKIARYLYGGAEVYLERKFALIKEYL
jgi:LAGLIDADG DNA endonuclease family protein